MRMNRYVINSQAMPRVCKKQSGVMGVREAALETMVARPLRK